MKTEEFDSPRSDSNYLIFKPLWKDKKNFFQALWEMARGVVRARELIGQLFYRDFIATYKKSVLGKSWIVLSPMIGILSWIFMNYVGLIKPGNFPIPYPAYLLISNTIWGLFTGVAISSSSTLRSGSSFIQQVYFPHEALLAKQVAEQLANFSLCLVIIIAILIAFGIQPSFLLLISPIFLIPIVFAGVSIGLFISVFSVVIPDLVKILDYVLGFLLFLTPVIYSQGSSGLLSEINKWNPLTYLIGGFRDFILFGKYEFFGEYLVVSGVSFVMFLISWRFFHASEKLVIEKMMN